MRKLTGLLLLYFFISCGKENKSSDTTNDNSKSTNSDSTIIANRKEKKDSIIIDPKLSFEEKATKFREKYALEYNEIESDKSIFPERFENKWKMKFFCERESSEFYFLEYADTTAKQNVKNNWLNCFGKDCITIKENEKQKGNKSQSCLVIFNEKEIIYYGRECNKNESINEGLINELKTLFGNKKSKYLQIFCTGVLNWK